MRAVNTLIYVLLFNLTPTLLELGLVCYIIANTAPGGPAVALTCLSSMALYTVFTFWMTKWRIGFRKELNAIESQTSQRLHEGLTNYEAVKLYNKERWELDRYEGLLEQFRGYSAKNNWSFAALNFGQAFIFSVAMALISALCASHVQSGAMTVGDLVMVNGLMLQLSWPLHFLGTIYRELTQSSLDMQTLFRLFDRTTEREKEKKKREEHFPLFSYRPSGGGIEFRNVSFRYPTEKDEASIIMNPQTNSPSSASSPTTGTPQNQCTEKQEKSATSVNSDAILRDISFTVRPGQVVGVVGPTASGKSTLLRLLAKFYEPTEGTIWLDDQPLHRLTPDSVRKALGYLTQDIVLFNDTVRFNIAYGAEEQAREKNTNETTTSSQTNGEEVGNEAKEKGKESEKRTAGGRDGEAMSPSSCPDPFSLSHVPFSAIQHAATRADLHNGICALPQGYDTLVGERGLRLSGGEKQRLALARMLLKDPVILLADEATASLDTHTEANVMNALKQSGRTVLLVAHRLTTVRDADCIVVLDKGRVVEQGTHQELLCGVASGGKGYEGAENGERGKRAKGLYAQMWEKQSLEKTVRCEAKE